MDSVSFNVPYSETMFPYPLAHDVDANIIVQGLGVGKTTDLVFVDDGKAIQITVKFDYTFPWARFDEWFQNPTPVALVIDTQNGVTVWSLERVSMRGE